MEMLLIILYMDLVQPQAIALPSQWLLMPAMDLKYIQVLQLTQHYTVSHINYTVYSQITNLYNLYIDMPVVILARSHYTFVFTFYMK